MQIQLENSNKSPFTLKEVYHDGKWFELEGNTTVLPSGKCLLSFYFDSSKDIFLSVEDMLGNKYGYSLLVSPINGLIESAILSSNDREFYTLREIKENLKQEDKSDGK